MRRGLCHLEIIVCITGAVQTCSVIAFQAVNGLLKGFEPLESSQAGVWRASRATAHAAVACRKAAVILCQLSHSNSNGMQMDATIVLLREKRRWILQFATQHPVESDDRCTGMEPRVPPYKAVSTDETP